MTLIASRFVEEWLEFIYPRVVAEVLRRLRKLVCDFLHEQRLVCGQKTVILGFLSSKSAEVSSSDGLTAGGASAVGRVDPDVVRQCL